MGVKTDSDKQKPTLNCKTKCNFFLTFTFTNLHLILQFLIFGVYLTYTVQLITKYDLLWANIYLYLIEHSVPESIYTRYKTIHRIVLLNARAYQGSILSIIKKAPFGINPMVLFYGGDEENHWALLRLNNTFDPMPYRYTIVHSVPESTYTRYKTIHRIVLLNARAFRSSILPIIKKVPFGINPMVLFWQMTSIFIKSSYWPILHLLQN